MSQGDFTQSLQMRKVIVPPHSRDPPVLSAIRFHAQVNDPDSHSLTSDYTIGIQNPTADDGKVHEGKIVSGSSMAVRLEHST